jgi:transposase
VCGLCQGQGQLTAPDSTRPTINQAGFRRVNAKGETEFYVLPEAFKAELCAGQDWRFVAKQLIERGKGVKIMAIVERHGLPLAASTHAANHHEVTLVQVSFDFYMIEAKPENLIGDRAYDSDKLDEELRKDGIAMIAPHRSNRKKRKTQDGRRLRRYERRWLVERFFAWIQWQRRLLIRWEYYAENFLGFVQLATIAILLRQF